MANTASKNEESVLMEALTEPGHDEFWEELVIEITAETPGPQLISDWDDVRAVLISEMRKPATRQVHRIHFLKTTWLRYAAAIILIFGIGAYLYTLNDRKNPQITGTKLASVKNDIMPGSNRAVLTLSGGDKVELDSAASETIQDGTLFIENNNGQLIYKSNGVVAMNTMTTPKGGQYKLTLADGTKVWLNAASSITYPTAFAGSERRVTVKGEAYFEVAKDAKKPFTINIDDKSNVEVLGTDFNVNAYDDEPFIHTTLINGSVRINGIILKPRQQASVDANNKSSEVTINTNVDIAQVIAWKEGLFNFNDLPLKDVMKQVARWYDLEVVYDKDVPQIRFYGEVQRNLHLSQLLKVLSGMGVQFRLEKSNRLVVSKDQNI